MKTDHAIARGKRTNLSRRTLLKSLTAAAAATVLPSGMERLVALVQNVPAQKGPPSASPMRTTNPAWYGFNLLEYFSTDPDWMKYDTERPGTKYEDWRGHQLDRALLNLLQNKMKA